MHTSNSQNYENTVIATVKRDLELLVYSQLSFCCCCAGILVEAYAPLGSPTRYEVSESDPVVMEDPVINEIATKKGTTPAQVCIYDMP